MADGHLAVANFGESAGLITFKAPRSELSAIPIFGGVTRVDEDTVTYSRDLGAGEALLQKVILNVETTGSFEVNAAETGEVWARNTGDAPAGLAHNGAETLVPQGAIVALA